MKKFKKILSMVLTLAISMSFLCGTTVWAATTDEDVGQVSVPYNAEITNGIVKNSPDVATHNADISDPQDITIQLAKDTSGSYTATGTFTVASNSSEYSVCGDLLEVETRSGTGLIGYMSGSLSDGTHIGFNLHYIPNTQKIFVYASVGYVTSESDCETYIFGNTFDEMNELVSAFSGMADETFGEDEEPVSAAGEDVAPLAATDYNITYRGIGIGQGELINGNRVDLIATTVYTPKRMGPNEVFKGYVKVNGHNGNAKTYIQGTKLIPGALSAWVTGGTCAISSPNDNSMEMSNMDPGDDSWNVEIPIPYYVNGVWGVLPWNLNITIYTIKTTLSKNSGSILNNSATWKHNYSENVNWGDSGAAATQKGYAGCCSMSYQYNKSYPTTTSVTGSGSLDYSYSSMYGATSYTGNFSAYSSVSVNIGIDARK